MKLRSEEMNVRGVEGLLLDLDQYIQAPGEDTTIDLRDALRKRIGEELANINAIKPLDEQSLKALGYDVLFGPFAHSDWDGSNADQMRNLLNDFEQTHEAIIVRRVAIVKQGQQMEGNAIIGKAKANVDAGVLQTCPRRIEDGRGPGSPFVGSGKGDVWGKDRTCSYCGSMHPDAFMEAVRAGQQVVPTDKSYKAYIGTAHTKFYFQHLSVDQRKELIDLLNDKKINFAMPGRFYVLPFFMTTVKPEAQTG